MALDDYALYLPPDTDAVRTWGVAVTAAGFTRIRAGAAYPPPRHPSSHLFTWETGRVLPQHQIVYITAGSGQFESSATGLIPIRPGTLFVLMPGVWHRYRPDPKTGWVEHWLELVGPDLGRLHQEGVIRPERAVLYLGQQPHLVELFEQCHHLLRESSRLSPGAIGSLGLAILAQAMEGFSSADTTDPNDLAVNRALLLMSEAVGRTLLMEQLAEQVGVEPSRFRRAFASRTGLSPKQYHIQLRLRRAQELLTSTPMQIQEIADQLGFSSPFHLSKQFHQLTGISPTEWRSRHKQLEAVRLREARNGGGGR